MPTSGTNRPGPLGGLPSTTPLGVVPVHLQLERLGIAADIDSVTFEGELPSEPAAPERLAWYQRSALLGIPGVVFIGGVSTTFETGPSAFTRLSEVEAGDLIAITGKNGGVFNFMVNRSEAMSGAPDFSSLLASTIGEHLLLLGWNETFAAAVGLGQVHLVTGVRVVVTPPSD